MIQVNNLVKSFDGYMALDHLTMTVKKGSVYGLVGPNGAGKSTIIRHITGIYRQDEGEVLIAGENVYENAAVKSKFAYIPDDIFYFHNANTIDMMKFYKGLYPKFSTKRFNDLKDLFPTIDLKKPIRLLSKGMQKQSAFLIAISICPEVLILDEPVDGLDPVMRRQIWSIIMADNTEYETTILVSSHNLRELEDVCSHVGILDHGKILIERSLSELQDNIVKLQMAFSETDITFPANLDILHHSSTGRMHTLIIKGDISSAENKLNELNPLFIDAIPLTLEEIFIYELGGAGYECKEIIL